MAEELKQVGRAGEEVTGPPGEVPHCGTCWTGRKRVVAIVTVAVVAVGVRSIHVEESGEVPCIRHLIGDARGYYDWAERIAEGAWLGGEAFYQAPLYPYVLAVCFKVFGAEVGVVRWGQALWGGVGVVCLWYGTSRYFGGRVGLVAALMLGLYGPAVYFDGIVQKASLGCVIVCGLWAAMGRMAGARRCGAAAVVVVGVVAGLSILTRENAMVWVPIVAVWVWLSEERGVRRRRGWALLGFGVGLGVVLVPVGVRNKVVSGEWSVSTFQAGPNFYIGNRTGADGRYQPLVRGHETPVFERKDATQLAERAMGRELSAREVSRYWMSRALGDIASDPVGWLGLMGRKMLMVWNRYEVSDIESQYVYGDYSMTLRALGAVWHFGVLCPLAAIGVVATWGARRRLWVFYALIVSMALAVALFYVMARYRFPLVPLLIPFAAAGCVDLWDRIRLVEVRPLLLRAAVALIVAVVVNVPIHDEKRLDALAWMNVGVALAEDGDLVGATPCFRRAVEGHPGSAEANNNLAQALALQGNFAEAVVHYDRALVAEPMLAGVDFNLAVALERLGRLEEALVQYERAAKLDPEDAEARGAIKRLRRSGQ